MTELERALQRLAAEVEWPSTPSFELRHARARRRWLVAVALIVLALGIAFAVPPARSALLRFLHIGSVTIERVDTLPAAVERPLRASLGSPVSAAAARGPLGAAFRAPAG